MTLVINEIGTDVEKVVNTILAECKLTFIRCFFPKRIQLIAHRSRIYNNLHDFCSSIFEERTILTDHLRSTSRDWCNSDPLLVLHLPLLRETTENHRRNTP